jgi:hypothetical protein
MQHLGGAVRHDVRSRLARMVRIVMLLLLAVSSVGCPPKDDRECRDKCWKLEDTTSQACGSRRPKTEACLEACDSK